MKIYIYMLSIAFNLNLSRILNFLNMFFRIELLYALNYELVGLILQIALERSRSLFKPSLKVT